MSQLFVIILCLLSFSSYSQEEWKPSIPKGYVAYKVKEEMKIDGKEEEQIWSQIEWTDDFVDIEGDRKPKPKYRTAVKICWDDSFIYFLAKMEEPHVWGDITQRDAVMFYNNDFEIFMKPYTGATHYAELEVNALGTAWDLLLMNAYRKGGPIMNQWDIDGLQVGIDIDGTLNKFKDEDKSWSAEIAIPWSVLDELLFGKRHKTVPDPWRVNFSRVQWQHEVVDGKYHRKKDAEGKYLPESNWVWSPQQAIDMHRPEHWGYLFFSEEAVGSEKYEADEYEALRQYLFHLYRQQLWIKKKEGSYTDLIGSFFPGSLTLGENTIKPQIELTKMGFEISAIYLEKELIINERGELLEKALDEDFVFAVWGHGNKERSDEEWMSVFRKYRLAGVTDFFLGGGAEELKRMVRITKEMDIRIHGWVWTLNRPGDSIAKKHPDWYAVNKKGQNSLEYNAYVGYYQWLSPFSEGARNHIKENIQKIAAIEGLESVHLDYVRYVDVILGAALQPKYNLVQDHEMPEYDYGYHPNARREFEKIFGVDPMEMEHPELSTEWRQFRLNAVTSLVNELAEICHDSNQRISAAVFPFPTMSRSMVRQDWSNWDLDYALPMIYHNFYNQNLNWIQFVTEQGVNEIDGRFPLYSGLYLPALSPEELDTAILNSIQGGAKGVSIFEMNGLTDEHLEVIRKHSKKPIKRKRRR